MSAGDTAIPEIQSDRECRFMKALSYLNLPLWILGVAGSEKSLRKNPILGSPYLNRLGLHRTRVSVAAKMAQMRRARLASSLSEADRRSFDENGYFLTEDFLPKDDFEALRKAAFEERFDAREMRQGQAITRMVPLPPEVLDRHPAVARALRDPRALAQIRYAASQGGEPLGFFRLSLSIRPAARIRNRISTPIRFMPRPRHGCFFRMSVRKTAHSVLSPVRTG